LVINSLVSPDDGFLTRMETLADGSPLPPLFPIGRPIGIEFVIGNLTSGTPGDFTQSFSSSSFTTYTGLASVPEPASWVLGMIAMATMGLFGLVTRRGYRR
jgi:hypothetical protein